MPASRRARARETRARARDATQHSPPVRDVVVVGVVVGVGVGVAVWPAARNEHPGVDRPSRGGTRHQSRPEASVNDWSSRRDSEGLAHQSRPHVLVNDWSRGGTPRARAKIAPTRRVRPPRATSVARRRAPVRDADGRKRRTDAPRTHRSRERDSQRRTRVRNRTSIGAPERGALTAACTARSAAHRARWGRRRAGRR